VILGGLIAGIGGASLTIGSVGSFGKDISSGRVTSPGGDDLRTLDTTRATGAALLFGFSLACASVLGTIGAPIPPTSCSCSPTSRRSSRHRIRGPQPCAEADGQPYIKA